MVKIKKKEALHTLSLMEILREGIAKNSEFPASKCYRELVLL
jgi:hypothetical protein